MSDEDPDKYTRNQVYQEGPRSDGHRMPKTRDLSPYFCREKRQMPRFCGSMMGPRVDLRRMASSRLLET